MKFISNFNYFFRINAFFLNSLVDFKTFSTSLPQYIFYFYENGLTSYRSVIAAVSRNLQSLFLGKKIKDTLLSTLVMNFQRICFYIMLASFSSLSVNGWEHGNFNSSYFFFFFLIILLSSFQLEFIFFLSHICKETGAKSEPDLVLYCKLNSHFTKIPLYPTLKLNFS